MPISSNTSPSAVDYANNLLEKTAHNKALTLSLFKRLFLELPDQTREIEQALRRQDLASAYQIIHKLHGSVSFCGLTDIQLPAYLLEACLYRRDADPAWVHLNNLQAQINHLLTCKTSIIDYLSH